MLRLLLLAISFMLQAGLVLAAAPVPKSQSNTTVDLDANAAKIDELIEANLSKRAQSPNPSLTDEQFVRRVYLDIIGRIPTTEEARKFLGSSSPARRNDLIDRLLKSEGYVTHFFNYWADVLRARNAGFNLSERSDETLEANYTFWIKEALRENKPYNQLVHELLVANGSLALNGATGYHLRDEGNRLANYEATTAVFLGGTVHGASDAKGENVFEEETTVLDLHATIAHLLGLPVDQIRSPFDGGQGFFVIGKDTGMTGRVIESVIRTG